MIKGRGRRRKKKKREFIAKEEGEGEKITGRSENEKRKGERVE